MKPQFKTLGPGRYGIGFIVIKNRWALCLGWFFFGTMERGK